MKILIILDMKKNKIDHFSLKIIVLTTEGVLNGTVKTLFTCPHIDIKLRNSFMFAICFNLFYSYQAYIKSA